MTECLVSCLPKRDGSKGANSEEEVHKLLPPVKINLFKIPSPLHRINTFGWEFRAPPKCLLKGIEDEEKTAAELSSEWSPKSSLLVSISIPGADKSYQFVCVKRHNLVAPAHSISFSHSVNVVATKKVVLKTLPISFHQTTIYPPDQLTSNNRRKLLAKARSRSS